MSERGSSLVEDNYVPMIGCFVAGFVVNRLMNHQDVVTGTINEGNKTVDKMKDKMEDKIVKDVGKVWLAIIIWFLVNTYFQMGSLWYENTHKDKWWLRKEWGVKGWVITAVIGVLINLIINLWVLDEGSGGASSFWKKAKECFGEGECILKVVIIGFFIIVFILLMKKLKGRAQKSRDMKESP